MPTIELGDDDQLSSSCDVLAFLAFHGVGSSFFVDFVYVSPPHRRRQLATLLFSYFQGKQVELIVKKNNVAALATYAKFALAAVHDCCYTPGVNELGLQGRIPRQHGVCHLSRSYSVFKRKWGELTATEKQFMTGAVSMVESVSLKQSEGILRGRSDVTDAPDRRMRYILVGPMLSA